MAGLTKDELKSALVTHGVEMNLSAAKKDELVALYEEFVSPHDFKAGEFSSDDEASSPIKKAKTSRSSKGSKKSKLALSDNGKELTEENSLIVGDVNLNELTDEELIRYLQTYDIDVGPIVDSTRSLYQKKLAIVMREKCKEDHVDSTENGHQVINGNQEVEAAEFSADEDVNTEEEEQPSVVVKKSSRNPTPKKSISSSKTSPLQALGSSLRQRFGSSQQAERKEGNDRFTPTPRRSIHSYKITETTKQTMTKSKDGLVTHDIVYNKETSESTSGSSRLAVVVFKVLPGIFLLLIIAALAYYVSSKRAS